MDTITRKITLQRWSGHRRIIAHPEASMNRVAEAKNVEGNVYWQRGEREDARSQYQEVFTLHTSDGP